MAGASFQRLWQKYIWDSRANLENPLVSLSGANLIGLEPGEKTLSGEIVNESSALTFAAVHRANRLICDIMAYLPVNVIERNTNGSKAVAQSHPAQFFLKHEPNSMMSSFTWREAMQSNLNFRGNGYSEILGSSFSDLRGFKFHPHNMVEPKVRDNQVFYTVTEVDDNGKMNKRTLPYDQMIHVPGFGFNGVVGMSTLDIAAESWGGAIAAQKSAGSFYANDATPSSILYRQDATPDQADAAKQAWQRAHGGTKRGGTAVLPGEWRYEQISITPEQAQFLQTRQFSITEIARWFGVPPHLLFDLDRSTFNNIEHQGIEFLIYTLNGWVSRWEQELSRKLFTRQERERERFFVKFNTNAILRTDISARGEFYRTLWSVGALSTNDILQLEDMNSVEGGDKRFVQQGFMPLDKVDEVLLGNKVGSNNAN